MPLTAWPGWTQSPGDVPGYGPLDAEDSRIAHGPNSQWCVTLTGRAGHPVAHACARHRPPGPPTPPAASHQQPKPPRTAEPGPARPGPTRPAPTGPGPAGPSPPGRGPGPGVLVPDWLRGLTFTTLQTTDCTHPRESRGYQPSPALRHLIHIRNPACTSPICRRPATRCDLDHVTPYDQRRPDLRMQSAPRLQVITTHLGLAVLDPIPRQRCPGLSVSGGLCRVPGHHAGIDGPGRPRRKIRLRRRVPSRRTRGSWRMPRSVAPSFRIAAADRPFRSSVRS